MATRIGLSRALSLFAAGMIILMYSSCEIAEIPTSVRLTQGPSFSLRGSGRLAMFLVYAPVAGQKVAFPHTKISTVVWEISCSKGYFDGHYVEGLHLEYGKTPAGYTQVVPRRPDTALRLPPGKIYSYWAESTGAPIASGSFYVDSAGSVQEVKTDLCLMFKNKQSVRVSCGTGEPYQEPADIKKYLELHRVQ